MIKRDLHTHTTYSDGKASAEEMVLAALERGLAEIGISDHSYTFFDESYCMKKESIPAYVREIAALKEKYAGKIRVLCGVEQDLFSKESTAPFDYAIGSSHYLFTAGGYHSLDEHKEDFVAVCRNYFGRDYYALAEAYFRQMEGFAERDDVTVIGHLDLITKYNEGNNLFDEEHPRFLAAAKRCIDLLAKAGKTFEINTGAMARGYRTTPYPGKKLLTYIKAKNCPLILSSDAHTPKNVGYAFEQCETLCE